MVNRGQREVWDEFSADERRKSGVEFERASSTCVVRVDRISEREWLTPINADDEEGNDYAIHLLKPGGQLSSAERGLRSAAGPFDTTLLDVAHSLLEVADAGEAEESARSIKP